jgi:hypothetical protein
MIKDASKKSIKESLDMPDVSDAVMSLLQPMKVGIVQKQQIGGLTQEIPIYVDTFAVKQPFSAQRLDIKPEGQRSWRWFTLHSLKDLVLKLDDIIILAEIKYRVMQKYDYAEYGFYQYEIAEGFQE